MPMYSNEYIQKLADGGSADMPQKSTNESGEPSYVNRWDDVLLDADAPGEAENEAEQDANSYSFPYAGSSNKVSRSLSDLATAMSLIMRSAGYPKRAAKFRLMARVSGDQRILDEARKSVLLNNKTAQKHLADRAEAHYVKDAALATLLGGVPSQPNEDPTDTEKQWNRDHPNNPESPGDDLIETEEHVHPIMHSKTTSLDICIPEKVLNSSVEVFVTHTPTWRTGRLVEVRGPQAKVAWSDGGVSAVNVADTLWHTADNSRMNELMNQIDQREEKANGEVEDNTPSASEKVSNMAGYKENLKISSSVVLSRAISDLEEQFNEQVALSNTTAASRLDSLISWIEDELTNRRVAAEENDRDVVEDAEETHPMTDYEAVDANPLAESVIEPAPSGEVQGNSPMNQTTPVDMTQDIQSDEEHYNVGTPKQGSRIVIEWPSSVHHGRTGIFVEADGPYASVVLDDDDEQKQRSVESRYVRVAQEKHHGVHDAVMTQTKMDYYNTDPHADAGRTMFDHVNTDTNWPDPTALPTPPENSNTSYASMNGVNTQIFASRTDGGNFQSDDGTTIKAPSALKFEHTSWDGIVNQAQSSGVDVIASAHAANISQQEKDSALEVLGL